MNDIIIRVMTIEDYSKVYELWTNIPGMGLNNVDDSYDGIKRYLNRNPDTSFVAIKDDKMIGVILSGHDGRRGFIYHTAVLPQYRGRGVGRRLVNSSLETLNKEGISKVALLAFSKNVTGNYFWESAGFGARDDCTYRDKKLIDIKYNDNPYIGN